MAMPPTGHEGASFLQDASRNGVWQPTEDGRVSRLYLSLDLESRSLSLRLLPPLLEDKQDLS